MKTNIESNELFRASHLTILVSYTVFSVVLVTEAILLSWEPWALLLIGVALVFSWSIHITHRFSDRVRLWIYSVLMMCTYFFYGIHQTSTFDLSTVMNSVIILYTMTGIKSLVTVCQLTYCVTFAYDLAVMIQNGTVFDTLTATRLLLHVGLIIMVGKICKMIIDKWLKVLGSSHREIEQLTEATDRLNDFLANVSHEIRTPINAVIGLSGICADKEPDAALRENMISVNIAGRRVAEQIGDILDFSEIDRGMLARNDENYMLSSLLSDLVAGIRPYKPEHTELIIDVDPSIPSVMNTDTGKLKKILRHLIVNGLKYTRDGGVYVRMNALKEDYGVNLCIEITDTGIGMTPEETERATERFYQVNSGRTRSSSGLGLGLPIVNGFVDSLGGFMHIKSEPGKGTTVHVSLPQKVVDAESCMTIVDRSKLCLGAFLHLEKFPRPEVREYYNIMVRNIVNGLGVQMHRVDNAVSLDKLLRTVKLTHLFVGGEEYSENRALLEKLAKKITVIVAANDSFRLPEGSGARVVRKPFYCFPAASILNEEIDGSEHDEGRMYCRGVRALVVDDEPMNLTVARTVFGRYGMQVFTADSGQEAVELCRSKGYDIVFMDHMMPGMDGVEAMKLIRSDPHRARGDLPIVALTANAVSTAKEMFLSEGFDGFVSKPIELVELERVLKKVLPASAITFEKAPAPVTESPAPEKAKSERPEQPADDPLERVGVDTDAGLRYCMNDEGFYKSLLLQFASESDEKRAAMEKHFAARDLKNYTVFVHALKSTSKMIGCMSLSENARELELAAKEGRADYIEDNHARVMRQYRELTDAINSVYGHSGAYSADDGEILGFEPQSPSGADSGEDVIEFEPFGTEE